MKEHFLIDGLQQFIAFLMVMEGGKPEGVTIGNGSVQVLVQGPFSRHGLAGHFFVYPDVKGGLIAVERIAGHPAITSDDFENYFSGVVDPEDVCVDTKTVVGLGEDLLFTYHGVWPSFSPGDWI